MVKLFSCLFSLLNRSHKKQLDCQFEIDALPDHLVIAILNKMSGRTFCQTYSTCHYMAELADQGRGKLAVVAGNPPNLGIEYGPRMVSKGSTCVFVNCFILYVSYPTFHKPRRSSDPTLTVVSCYPQGIDDITRHLCKYSYFQFNRVAIWTAKYSDKEGSKKLVSILRRQGIKCSSLIVDDEELLPSLVDVIRPKELDIKSHFVFEKIPRLSKMGINIVGFHPRFWEKIKEELMLHCERIHLQIDMASEATTLEIGEFIEKIAMLHLPKVAVSIQLPRTIFQDNAFDGTAIFNRMVEDLVICNHVQSRTCTVLIYDSATYWQLRTFSLYREMEQFLLSHRKFQKEENRSELECRLKEAKLILER